MTNDEREMKAAARHWGKVGGKRPMSATERGLDEFRKLRAREAEESKDAIERKRGAAIARRAIRNGFILGGSR